MTPLLQFALRNLLTRPLRTTLSLIGLSVAIAAMVGLFSVANGLDHMIQDTFSRIPGLIVVQPGAPIPLFSRLPAAWGPEIAQTPGVSVVNEELWNRAQIIEGKQVFSPPRFLFGTDIASRVKLRHGVYRDALVQGRFLQPEDAGTFNTVVSTRIADEFQKKVGDTLRVDGQTLTIVGLYNCNSLFLDVTIILDINAVRLISRTGPETVSAFYIEQDNGVEADTIVAAVQERFRGRKLDAVDPNQFMNLALNGPGGAEQQALNNPLVKLLITILSANNPPPQPPEQEPAPPTAAEETQTEPAEELPLEIRSVEEWTNDFEKFSADLDIFLVIMTAIGIIIAVVSILNTMLMSVSERSIEFGILKANGWSRRDILILIGLESGLLGVAGGLCGAAIGWLATQIVNYYWSERIFLYAGPGLLIGSVIFSTLLGVAGGMYPAFLAARMTPMNAIRRG